MSKEKVTLVTFEPTVYDFSVNSIAAYLKSKEYDVDVIHCLPYGDDDDQIFGLLSEEQLENLAKKCKGTKAVGISVLVTHYLKRAIQINDFIKKTLKVPVVWGGVPIICDPEFYLNHADYVCTGEGEKFMEEFLKRIMNGQSLNETRGMAYKSEKGKIVSNPAFPLVDLNEIPLPVIDLDKQFFLQKSITSLKEDRSPIFRSGFRSREYRIFPIRGCPFKCTYCSNNKLSKVFAGQERLRHLRPELIIKELLEAKKIIPDIDGIMFYEDDFFVRNKEELTNLVTLYKKNIDIPININASIFTITEEKVDIIKNSGIELQFVKIGLQTASERINREIYRKSFNKSIYMDKIQMLAKKNIPMIIDTISNNPYEKSSDRAENAKFFTELSGRLPKSVNTWNLIDILDHKLMFYPGTELYEMGMRDGIISKNYIDEVLLKKTTTMHLFNENKIDIDLLIFRLFKRSLKSKGLYRLLRCISNPLVFPFIDNTITARTASLFLKIRNAARKALKPA